VDFTALMMSLQLLPLLQYQAWLNRAGATESCKDPATHQLQGVWALYVLLCRPHHTTMHKWLMLAC
jgi:hypothetical protein